MSQKSMVIFVCLHGSAKSIVAAAYFNKIVAEAGIELRAIARGLQPDLKLSEATTGGLFKDGLSASESVPQKLLPEELETASRVVSFCELPDDYPGKAVIECWYDVPPVSEEYEKARDFIVARIREMMKELV